MANRFAVANGNWSDPSTWDGLTTVPTSADDVYANNRTVTVDVSATVLTVRNTSATGIAAGGNFSLGNGCNLTCTNTLTTVGNNSTLFTFSLSSPQSATLSANISASNGPPVTYITHTGTGTLNITGNVGYTYFSGSGRVLVNSSSGTVNIIGNVFGYTGYNATNYAILNSGIGTITIIGSVSSGGGGGQSGSSGIIANTSSGTITITGDVTGPTTGGDYTCNNSSIGTINVTGTIYGGAGIALFNNSTGSISILGSCISITNVAVVNSSSGTLTHTGAAIVNGTTPAIGGGSASQNTYLTGPFIGSAQGVVANLATRWRWIAAVGSSYMTAVTSGAGGTATGYKNLYTADSTLSNSGQPGISSVRSGVIYGPNSELTGTMVVPATNTVLAGVSVGNTIGTASFATPSEFWNFAISGITTSGSIGERLKTAATVSTVNSILSNGLR